MKKINIIFLMSLILFSNIVIADYTQSGGENYNYSTPSGDFNHNLLDTAVKTRSITGTALFSPLTFDFDGDGLNEIVVLSSSGIEIFRGNTLNQISAYSTSCAKASNVIITDIDDDNNSEIIFACPSQDLIFMLSFINDTLWPASMGRVCRSIWGIITLM